MHTPADKPAIAFTFASHPAKKSVLRWTAVLTFPPGAGPETELAFRVTDGEGHLVPEGVFEFAGRKLPVKNGAASLPYADFIRGKHETALWLHRPGMVPVPGGLTFA